MAVATVLEYFVLGPGAPVVVFALFVLVFAGALAGMGVAAAELALGGRGERRRSRLGRDGQEPHGPGAAVGTSLLGRAALLTYGAGGITAQVTYFVYRFLLPPSNWNYVFVTVSTLTLAIAFVAGFVAAIVIAVRHVVIGLARWCLLLSLVLSIVAGAVSTSSDSLGLLTAMEIVSALGQVVVGVAFLFARDR